MLPADRSYSPDHQEVRGNGRELRADQMLFATYFILAAVGHSRTDSYRSGTVGTVCAVEVPTDLSSNLVKDRRCYRSRTSTLSYATNIAQLNKREAGKALLLPDCCLQWSEPDSSRQVTIAAPRFTRDQWYERRSKSFLDALFGADVEL